MPDLYKPKKSLGQNFMLAREVSSYMVSVLDLVPGDIVVEIGSGLGAVTQELADALFEPSSHIFAVEIDTRFIPKLREMFRSYLNVSVIHADILEWLPAQSFTSDFKILGSLPFYITSPILHMLAFLDKRPKVSVLLVQKEVGETISAEVPKGSYLSVFLQTFFEVTYLKTVPKTVFDPVPKVDGALVKLEFRESIPPQLATQESVRRYSKFLHRGFSHPRKMLNKVFSKEELASVGISGSLRPHDLSIPLWVDLFTTLVGY